MPLSLLKFTAITIPRIDGGFLHNILFEAVWNDNILITSLFALRLKCPIHFSSSCSESSCDMISDIGYISLRFCSIIRRGSKEDDPRWHLEFSFDQEHFKFISENAVVSRWQFWYFSKTFGPMQDMHMDVDLARLFRKVPRVQRLGSCSVGQNQT